jgi:hypothetical protein
LGLAIVSNKQLIANVATLTVNSSSAIAVNDYIRVTGVDSTFNGVYIVSGIPSATQVSYPKISASVAFSAASGSVQYVGNDATGRPAAMYDSETDTWFSIAGKIDTGRNYIFNGTHTYESPTFYKDKLTVTASAIVGFELDTKIVSRQGINVFANAAARDVAIPNPVAGALVFLLDSNSQFYYTGSAWSQIESGDFEAFLLAGM